MNETSWRKLRRNDFEQSSAITLRKTGSEIQADALVPQPPDSEGAENQNQSKLGDMGRGLLVRLLGIITDRMKKRISHLCVIAAVNLGAVYEACR